MLWNSGCDLKSGKRHHRERLDKKCVFHFAGWCYSSEAVQGRAKTVDNGADRGSNHRCWIDNEDVRLSLFLSLDGVV
jgi:hypothetical protein